MSVNLPELVPAVEVAFLSLQQFQWKGNFEIRLIGSRPCAFGPLRFRIHCDFALVAEVIVRLNTGAAHKLNEG